MSDTDIKMSDGYVFDTWATTDCHECSCEFQVTRSVSKTIFGPVLCDECILHAEFNKKHDALVEQNKALRDALEGLCCSPHTRLTKYVLLEVSKADIDAAIKALEQAK